MQTFHEGMRIVQALAANDFKMPKDAELPNPMHREVARIYVERREFSVPEVLAAVALFAQPELLDAANGSVSAIDFDTTKSPDTSTMVSPVPTLLTP